MKKLWLVLVLLLSINLVYAQSCLQSARDNPKILYFFYGDECPHCKAAEPFLTEMQNKYNLTIIYHETWHNSSNKQIFEQFLSSYNVPKNSWGVPGFFQGSRYVIGYDNKDSKGKTIEEMIYSCLNNNCQEKATKIRFNFFGKNIEISSSTSLFILGIILGFADGFNPCTFAILIFLMSYLFTLSASKSRILKLGLVFAFVIFIVYILIMLGVLNLLAFIGFKSYGKIIVGIILLIIAGINIKDFFAKGFGFSLEIPAFARHVLERYVKKATIPAIIILAIILSFVELGCTLGLPLAYASIIAENGISGFSSFLYVVWYNIFYILPLLMIIVLVYFFVLETDKAEEYRVKLRKYMKLIGGLLMLVLALLLLFNLI